METTISIIALIVSVLALCAGGFLNAMWTRRVNRSRLTVDVMSVTKIEIDPETAEIDIPNEIVERSRAAKFFPTLEPREKRSTIKDYFDHLTTVDTAKARVKIAVKELQKEEVSDEQAGEIWGSLPTEAKAFLFSLRASRARRDSIEHLDPAKLVENFLGEGGETDVRKMLLQNTLGGALTEITQIEMNPTREMVLSVLTDDLERLELLATEVDYFSRNISLNDASTPPVEWRVRVKVHNAGGVPGVLYPIACAAIQRQAQGNIILVFESEIGADNLVVEPGEALDVSLRTSSHNSEDVLRSLEGDHATGDRDFVVVFEMPEGGRIQSGRANFSATLAANVRENLVKYSNTIQV